MCYVAALIVSNIRLAFLKYVAITVHLFHCQPDAFASITNVYGDRISKPEHASKCFLQGSISRVKADQHLDGQVGGTPHLNNRPVFNFGHGTTNLLTLDELREV